MWRRWSTKSNVVGLVDVYMFHVDWPFKDRWQMTPCAPRLNAIFSYIFTYCTVLTSLIDHSQISRDSSWNNLWRCRVQVYLDTLHIPMKIHYFLAESYIKHVQFWRLKSDLHKLLSVPKSTDSIRKVGLHIVISSYQGPVPWIRSLMTSLLYNIS